MHTGTRRASTHGNYGFTTGFTVSRETYSDIGYCHPTNPKGSVRFCRVQWSNHKEVEATWERQDLKKEFPYLFEEQSESRG